MVHPHIKDQLESIGNDLNGAFNRAVEESTESMRADIEREITTRLYLNSELTKFTQISVSQDSAMVINHAFRFMKVSEEIHPADIEMIAEAGQKYGFTKGEALCLYNMYRYGQAMDNMMNQRNAMCEILLDG